MGIHTGVSLVSHVDRDGSLVSSYESLGVFIESEEDADLQMEVTSPDGLNSWIFPVQKKRVDNQDFYGKSGLSLGPRVPLPRGEWSLRILQSDGRTLTENFTLEKASEQTSYQHHLDADTGFLVLDELVGECALLLLDETKKVLLRSTTTEQTIDLTSLYPQWDEVRLLGLSWYEETAKLSHEVWYTL